MIRWYSWAAILASVWLLFAVWHISAGAVSISMNDIWSTLTGASNAHEFTLFGYRIPRMIVASLVGAALALSGLLVQGVVRNPLASPDILGVTSGASFAVVLTNIFFNDLPVHWLPFVALTGGAISTLLLLALAKDMLNRPAAFALIGIALAAVFSAGIDFLLVSFPLEINTSMVWLTGSVWGRNWSHIPPLISWLVVLMPFAIYLAYKLDILGLGDEAAHGLGVKVPFVRLLTLIISIALACVAVSICGNIGFIGLVAPHAARMMVRGRHLAIIPSTLLIGAILLLSADLFARILMPPIELPAGVLTAFIGAPYFIYLLSRYKNW
ncbi:Fe(3+) dicitrate transport system permease protein FecD [Vibrio nigripulchritudo SO65]|uniref:iron chelate uptake ABC transporter family permease subunit n=1 Tax=Vibrio nigripulchritudo TaxID=28173 RepID=UPI0003B22519|nr:iron chelate uptake ABC transporter family permease subunit [Vibrio nigripulchritudo]CCN37356.1 Fe(3+) dicitrate transport system permease protein FecD [Vibrio nigripulchritudo AM115]CCN38883.1 Fe(3+) dicitrate transport system permease protein FecD [Vibrio nigripulchritudo FTn2]CCN66692.1 Fe(3+) dicitrate transport system permease protein FecD [Vibrio nigripulchritudo POn4]CCN76097.1 Fe(3+) dicitrate transport system permease protein FecD [Vibrio nigripulchritudo SO65]